MNFDDFSIAISKIKNITLPAQASHYKMVPSFRHEMIEEQAHAIKSAKTAGVLALFYPDENNQTHLVLTLRKTYKGVHSAQVGFPGGKIEAFDASVEAAAIRETFEEIGVPSESIQILQALTEVYIPPSNFYVHPFMGLSKNTPRFLKQDDEVEAIIEVKLDHFLDDANIILAKVNASYSVEVEVPAFKLNNYIVWGATAMMLSEIKDVLKQLM